MHPLNKHFFGSTGLAVTYNNGSATVTGYIVKQLGTSRYIVTQDGITKVTIRLVESPAEAATLPSHVGYIIVKPTAGGTQHASKIMSKSVHTVEGNDFIWNSLSEATASLTKVATSSGSSGGSSSGSSGGSSGS